MIIGRTGNKNRRSRFAGQFYPGYRDELHEELGNYFTQAEFKSSPQKEVPQALLAPHAGYMFSGSVAASAFNQIPKDTNYQTVFVLASSHNYSFPGASVYTHGNYETPLGEIKVDKKMGKKLLKSSNLFSEHKEAHLEEHSLEVLLPFLQYKLGGSLQLVPIILGTNRAEDCREIARALEAYFNSDNLFVISTDFSHYPNYNDAKDLDKITANAICSNKPEELLETIEENKNRGINNLATSLCGWTSVLTLLYLTEGKGYNYKQIEYLNSGDAKMYRDKNRVVGYWSIAIYKKDQGMHITELEKSEILEKARHSIKTFVETGKQGKIIHPKSDSGILHTICGAFVSIYVKGKLRGCIGGFAKGKSLNLMIQQMAKSAACDYRFDQIQSGDLKNMELEISVLSPLKKVKDISEIRLGKHGIYIEQGHNSGTFLPQVIDKTNWDLTEFLGHCSRDKAHIGWDGWKMADIYTYEATIIKG